MLRPKGGKHPIFSIAGELEVIRDFHRVYWCDSGFIWLIFARTSVEFVVVRRCRICC